MSSTKQERVIFISGANKGLGFLVVKKLLAASSTNNNDIILLGSRDLQRGQEALKQLGSPSNVHLLQVDTSSKESIAHATDEIKQKYGGQLDIIINNAGIASAATSLEKAREMLLTNYYGVKTVNEYLIPLLCNNGRIVNVASELGAWALNGASKDLQKKYTSPTLTVQQLDRLIEDYVSALESNTLDKIGYNSKMDLFNYGISKAALIILTRIQARQSGSDKKVFIYSVCPGYSATDINGHDPNARPAELGADSILYVVNTPNDQLENGAFYQDGKQISPTHE